MDEDRILSFIVIVIAIIAVIGGYLVTGLTKVFVEIVIVVFLILILASFAKSILKGGTIKMVREYKCVEVEYKVEDTQDKLNRLAKDNWKVVCSYAEGRWIILEREKLWY